MHKIFWKNNEPILLCSKTEKDNEWEVINGALTLMMISELQGYCKQYPETAFTFDKATDVPKNVTGDYNKILNESRKDNQYVYLCDCGRIYEHAHHAAECGDDFKVVKRSEIK